MNTVNLPADIKDNYINDFENFSRLYGNSFSNLRKQAIEAFSLTGFPTRKNEEWKYLNLAPVISHPYAIANPSSKSDLSVDDIARYKVAGADAIVLVFINGIYYESLSDVNKLNSKIHAGSLLSSDKNNLTGKSVVLQEYPFDALNSAFFTDGAIIHIPDGVDTGQPLHLLHLNDSRIESTSSFPRNLVVAGKNSKVQIITTYHSLNGNNLQWPQSPGQASGSLQHYRNKLMACYYKCAGGG